VLGLSVLLARTDELDESRGRRNAGGDSQGTAFEVGRGIGTTSRLSVLNELEAALANHCDESPNLVGLGWRCSSVAGHRRASVNHRFADARVRGSATGSQYGDAHRGCPAVENGQAMRPSHVGLGYHPVNGRAHRTCRRPGFVYTNVGYLGRHGEAERTTGLAQVSVSNQNGGAVRRVPSAPEGVRTNQPRRGVKTNQPRRGVKTNQPRRGVKTNQPRRGVKTNQPRRGVRTNQPRRGVRTNQPRRGVRTNQPRRGVRTNQPRRGVRTFRPGRSVLRLCRLCDASRAHPSLDPCFEFTLSLAATLLRSPPIVVSAHEAGVCPWADQVVKERRLVVAAEFGEDAFDKGLTGVHRVRLSVNVNKIATLRNSRSDQSKGPTGRPSVREAAQTCIAAGAPGITVHPRSDARHITFADVRDLADLLASHRGTVELNIEGDPRPDLVALVEEVRPDQFTIVPIVPGERTSQAGWSAETPLGPMQELIAKMHGIGTRVSVFVDPERQAIEWSASLGADRVELFTESFAQAFCAGPQAARAAFETFAAASRHAHELGLGVNAGHDLDADNLALFATLPHLEEVSIGHALIADALVDGLDRVVRRYLDVLAGAASNAPFA